MEQELKILQIGNYPPPVCGWSIQTKLLVEEIRHRGITCDVLNLSENRRKKSREYVDVQNIFDYLYKLLRFAWRGYHFQMHVNGQSKPGYVLALLAAMIGRIAGRPITLSWRGGLQQKYFPRSKAGWARFLTTREMPDRSCLSSAPDQDDPGKANREESGLPGLRDRRRRRGDREAALARGRGIGRKSVGPVD